MRVRSVVKIGAVAIAVLAVVVAGMVIAVKSVSPDRIKKMLTAQVQSATGRTLTIAGPLEIRLGLEPSVVASGITLSNPPGSTRPEMVKMERFEFEMALRPLLNRQIVINRLLLNAPDIVIETEAKGPGNLDFSPPDQQGRPAPPAATEQQEGAGASFSVTLREVKISNGVIALHDRTAKTTETVRIHELTLKPDTADPALLALQLLTTAREQKIDLAGTMGDINAILSGAPWPLKLKAAAKAIALNVEGRIDKLAALQGLNFKLTAQGEELGEVLRAAGVSLPELPQTLGPFTVTARVDNAGGRFNLSDLDLQAGRRELLLVEAKGGIKDLAGALAAELAVNLTSDNPAALAKIGGKDMALKGPLTVIARMNGNPTTLNINDFKATLQDLEVTAQGGIAELATLRGLDLKLNAQGKELGEVVRLAGVSKPELPKTLGPFTVAARLGNPDGRFNLADVNVQAGRRELLVVDAKGAIKDLTGALGVDLTVNLTSDNPTTLAKIGGSDLALKGPLQLAGKVSGGDTTWKVSNLKSSLGTSDLAGEVAVQLAKRTKVTGKLNAAAINPADFSPPQAASATKATAKTKGKSSQAKKGDGRLFPADPLPVDALRSVDADLALQVGKLQLDTQQIRDVRLTLQLNGGRLAVKPLRFALAGGTFEGEASLNAAGKTPALSLQLNGRRFEVGQLAANSPISGCKSDLNVNFKGSGDSVRSLMASSSGETRLSVGKGQMRNKAVDWAGGDLLFQVLGALNPFVKSENTTQIECAAVRFVLRDGIATFDKGIAMRTSQMDMVGSGTIDLRTERLDLGFKPRPRGGVGISVSAPLAGLVRVSGTLAKPGMGIDALGTMKTAASVGAGMATGGLSTLGEMLVDKVTADDDPCRTALGQTQSQSGTPKTTPGGTRR